MTKFDFTVGTAMALLLIVAFISVDYLEKL